MMCNIVLNGVSVPYFLERKKVKNINLRIKPNKDVYVSAPSSVSIQQIEGFLHSKADFILNAIKKYDDIIRFTPKPKQYVSGETICILGHELMLKVFQYKCNTVKFDDTYVYLFVKNTDDFNSKARTIDNWLKQYCEQIVRQTCKKTYDIFKKYGVKFPEIKFRHMVSRWGSCQPKRGILTFNYALIEVPMSCVEYVIIHEFTHFLQANHSKKFYSQISIFLPDWKQRKDLLEKHAIFSE